MPGNTPPGPRWIFAHPPNGSQFMSLKVRARTPRLSSTARLLDADAPRSLTSCLEGTIRTALLRSTLGVVCDAQRELSLRPLHKLARGHEV
jgi:hypothetical protein